VSLIESVLGRLFPPEPEPIAHAVRGRRVLLRGRVVARDTMDSPLTGVSCVYYHYVVETWSRSTTSWLVVEQDEAICEFYLRDDTACAVVSPHHARVELGAALHPDLVPVPEGRPGGRARETRIHAGDVVEVSGVLEDIEDLFDEGRGYREDMVRLIVRAEDARSLRIRLVSRAG
jgi:hypothetical protein